MPSPAGTGGLYVIQSEATYRVARATHETHRRRGARVEEVFTNEVRQGLGGNAG